MYEYLQDRLFLDQLDTLPIKEELIKITVLSWKENPIQEIQGKVINGSLNIDGKSSMRRTASLTVFAEEMVNDLTQVDDILSINRKIKLDIGIKNTVPNHIERIFHEDTNFTDFHTIDYKQVYGDIIWFPLGVFVIFDPNISHTTNGVNISLTLKDKMCLLNGDAGGVIPAAVEFHKREQEGPDGEVYVDQPTIKQIILEVVNHWGEEALSNIIVTDVDERIKQVMKWTGDAPLYHTTKNGHQYFLDYSEALRVAGDAKEIETLTFGQDIGFTLTDFVYPKELIGDVGQTVTGVLDQIIQLLGNYEYFYDVYGRFRFQEIKNYLNTTYTSYQLINQNTNINQDVDAIKELDYTIDLARDSSIYSFEGTKLVNSFANAPLYSNIKNDFVVWGVRKDTFGTQWPIRYHLAIDKKPKLLYDDKGKGYYGKHYGIELYTDEFDVIRARSYIMAFQSKKDFPTIGYDDRIYLDSSTNKYYVWNNEQLQYVIHTIDLNKVIITKDWREELYYQGIETATTATDFPYYYTELVEEWPKLYDLKEQKIKDEVFSNASSIDFFLDIIDIGSGVGKYSVDNIGRRSIAVNEEGINCVFEQEVPDVVFLDNTLSSVELKYLRKECDRMGQAYTQVDQEIYDLLELGGTQNSAYQRVCEMLYQYTNMNNNITIQALPIYYLEPNTRINVNDPASGIFGDFIIQTISIPLDINSTMSITASKALQKI